MSEQQTIPPLIKKTKGPIPKPQVRFRKTENIGRIASFAEGSIINLRTKRGGGVFVYIRPISKDIDNILELGTDKKDYKFDDIRPEKLRTNFLQITSHIKPINYSSLGSEVHLYLYSIQNKRKIYNLTEKLHIDHTS